MKTKKNALNILLREKKSELKGSQTDLVLPHEILSHS